MAKDKDENKDYGRDGEFIRTELDGDDEYYYDPVEAEIYEIIPEEPDDTDEPRRKRRKLTPEEKEALKQKEREEVLAFVNGETDELPLGDVVDAEKLFTGEDKKDDAGENEDSKIVDFYKASEDLGYDDGKLIPHPEIKNFIKYHVRDIIAYVIGSVIIIAAVFAALYLRHSAERVEAVNMYKAPPPPTPMLATPGDSEKATEDKAQKATKDEAEKNGKPTPKPTRHYGKDGNDNSEKAAPGMERRTDVTDTPTPTAKPPYREVTATPTAKATAAPSVTDGTVTAGLQTVTPAAK